MHMLVKVLELFLVSCYVALMSVVKYVRPKEGLPDSTKGSVIITDISKGH